MIRYFCDFCKTEVEYFDEFGQENGTAVELLATLDKPDKITLDGDPRRAALILCWGCADRLRMAFWEKYNKPTS